MRIDVRIDSAPLVLRLQNGQRRLAYAAVNAINNTAKRIQEAERRRVEEEFTIRKREFIRRQAAVIKPFANVRQGRAYAEIAVGQKPRLLLSAFERGAERKPFTPSARSVAEPVVGGPARPLFNLPVTPELRVGRLRFDRTKAGRPRAAVRRTRTYLVPSRRHLPAGPEEDDPPRLLLLPREAARAPAPVRGDRREGRPALVRGGDGARGGERDRAGAGARPVSGLCVTCGKNPRKRGRRQCGPCAYQAEDQEKARLRRQRGRAQRREYKRAQRRAAGCESMEVKRARAAQKRAESEARRAERKANTLAWRPWLQYPDGSAARYRSRYRHDPAFAQRERERAIVFRFTHPDIAVKSDRGNHWRLAASRADGSVTEDVVRALLEARECYLCGDRTHASQPVHRSPRRADPRRQPHGGQPRSVLSCHATARRLESRSGKPRKLVTN